MSSKNVSDQNQKTIFDELVVRKEFPSLNKADRAILKYAIKLTRSPNKMNRKDIEILRACGFDDRGIHDICGITGYFAFVNRMADGLGVELEDRFS